LSTDIEVPSLAWSSTWSLQILFPATLSGVR